MELEPDMERLVRRIALEQKRPTEAVIADALNGYVVHAEARKAFVAEADAAWDDYRATGRHVTGPELTGWLEGWGTNAGRAPPACHD